jgi:hypothetical protein
MARNQCLVGGIGWPGAAFLARDVPHSLQSSKQQMRLCFSARSGDSAHPANHIQPRLFSAEVAARLHVSCGTCANVSRSGNESETRLRVSSLLLPSSYRFLATHLLFLTGSSHVQGLQAWESKPTMLINIRPPTSRVRSD